MAVRVLVALLVFAPTAALAHYVYSSVWLYYSSDNCVWGRSEVSHGSGGGYLKVNIESYRRNISGLSCVLTYSRGSNDIRLKYTYLRHNGSTWGVCKDVSYQYNGSTAWSMQRTASYGVNPPCGSGWYGTQMYGDVRHGGVWYGGAIWSGSHLFDTGGAW